MDAVQAALAGVRSRIAAAVAAVRGRPSRVSPSRPSADPSAPPLPRAYAHSAPTGGPRVADYATYYGGSAAPLPRTFHPTPGRER